MKRHKEEAEWAAQVEKLIEGKGQAVKKEVAGEPGFFETVGRKLGGAGKRGMDGEEGDDMELDEEEADFGEKRGSRSKKRGLLSGFGK